tara:strand:+ start:4966 stop:5445 length:480 start_codon:yes stop_codon:yes gene_type:complete
MSQRLCTKCGYKVDVPNPGAPLFPERLKGKVYFLTCRECRKHWCDDGCAIEDDMISGFLQERNHDGERFITCRSCKKKNTTRGHCHIADQFCLAPANLNPLITVKSTCFDCGEAVCSKCSSRRKYLDYGIVRLCNDCQIEHDGNDKVVMKRMRKLAGIA